MPDTDTLPRDATFDLLSNQRRRFVISYLKRVDRPVSLNELAAEVAAWEDDVPVDSIDRSERKRVYVSLYQTHVPKLADAGVLEYDEDAGTVALADRGRSLSTYLVRGTDQPDWARYYLAAAVVGGVAYLALAYDVVVGIPDAAAVGFVLAGFLAIAVAQLRYARHAVQPEPRR